MSPLCRDIPITVCACGMPFIPGDPDETHEQHYLCSECRTKEEK